MAEEINDQAETVAPANAAGNTTPPANNSSPAEPVINKPTSFSITPPDSGVSQSRAFVAPPPIQAPKPVLEKEKTIFGKEYPTPQSLRAEPTPDVPPIPSKTSLADIPLPQLVNKTDQPNPALSRLEENKPLDPLLVHAFESSGSSAKVIAEATAKPQDRSMREVGIGDTPRLRPDMKIVKVNEKMRTELGKDGLPRIRTYAADLSDEIKKRGANLTTIIGAERERMAEEEARTREREGEMAEQRHRIFFLGGGALLIILGVIAITFAVYLTTRPETVALAPSIIPSNIRSVIPLTENGETLSQILADIRQNSTLTLGEVEDVIITESGVQKSSSALVLALGLPQQLARNTAHAMIGVHAFDRNQPFIIIKITSYDLAFEAMLSSEQRLAENLGKFFAPLNAPLRVPVLSFKDAIFQNIDLRVSQNDWPIVYAFPERNILVITTNESTLREVLSRLSISNVR